MPDTKDDNVQGKLLLRGGALWLIVALVLAWCLVGLALQLPGFGAVFPGKYQRVLQAHIDFLLMSALLLGFYGTRIALPWHVRWAMVIGAFTNSMLFLLMAIFPALDPAGPSPVTGFARTIFIGLNLLSFLITSYGFGRGAVLALRSTFTR